MFLFDIFYKVCYDNTVCCMELVYKNRRTGYVLKGECRLKNMAA